MTCSPGLRQGRFAMTWRKTLPLVLLGALVWLAPLASANEADTSNPSSVTVAGSLQSELGCTDDWQPACAATHLDFDADDQVWRRRSPSPQAIGSTKPRSMTGGTRNTG